MSLSLCLRRSVSISADQTVTMVGTIKEKAWRCRVIFCIGTFRLGTSGLHPHRQLFIPIFCLFFLTEQLIIQKLISQGEKHSFCLRSGIQALIILGMTKSHMWENQTYNQPFSVISDKYVKQHPALTHTQFSFTLTGLGRARHY